MSYETQGVGPWALLPFFIYAWKRRYAATVGQRDDDAPYVMDAPLRGSHMTESRGRDSSITTT